PPDEMRAQAISQVLAAKCERDDPRVQDFRRDHLGGKTLAPAEIAEWIGTRRAEDDADGGPSRYLMHIPGEAFRADMVTGEDGEEIRDGIILPESWVLALYRGAPIFATRGGGYVDSTCGPQDDTPGWEPKTLWYVEPGAQESSGEAVRA